MHFVRHILPALLLALLVTGGHPLWANEASLTPAQKLEERKALIGSVKDMTLAILQDQKKSFADREHSMKLGISNMVDIGWIAKFVLGSAWRSASDEQKARYTRLYGDYLMKMYIANFAQSSERKVSNMRILGIADSREDSFVARTEVQLSTAQQLHVDYLIREEKDSNQIVDIVIEGVSLLHTHRAEFARLAANGGITTVITKLEQLLELDKPVLDLSPVLNLSLK